MLKLERLEIGSIGLVQETEDGRIRQIALDAESSQKLQIFLAALSNNNPMVQMGEEYDLMLKKSKKK